MFVNFFRRTTNQKHPVNNKESLEIFCSVTRGDQGKKRISYVSSTSPLLDAALSIFKVRFL